MKKNGFLVISLDFELLWGVFDVVDYQTKETYFKNTTTVIPKILEQFEEKKIHATWAVVGMLFNKNWKEWEQNVPQQTPSYTKKYLSAYYFAKTIKTSSTEEMCFAPGLINQICNASGQEIATHTYSHYYCMEEGQTIEQFQADLERSIKVASEKNIKLKSLVFPRNQLNEKYLKICSELGIETVRSNPDDWYWKNPSSEALINKLFRTGEAYNPWAKRKSYRIEEMRSGKSLPLEQKASRFLRPHENRNFIQRLKMRKIKFEMFTAAKKGEIYHLWWHPHNFGKQPEESLKDLIEILEHFNFCREKYGFQSLNMWELNKLYGDRHKVKKS